MRSTFRALLVLIVTFPALLLLHLPLLRLPYFWDEAGYYVPAALDFYRSWLVIPTSTLPSGHTPLIMMYLGFAWRLFGYSPWTTRAAMTLVAAATVTVLYELGRRVANREIAAWSALLLVLSPLFFAQSTLAHLDIAAALFTTLSIFFLLREQPWLFALAASLAVLSKETAVVLLPVVWLYMWRKARGSAGGLRHHLFAWVPLVAPLVPLTAWALYYHHITGYWTGNREYLSYNLYSTVAPVRVFLTLLRRASELFIGGFNCLLTVSVPVGIWWGRKHRPRDTGHGTRGTAQGTRETALGTRDLGATRKPSPVSRVPCPACEVPPWRAFLFLAAGLTAVYLLLLSLVGGAILPRYLLPVMPFFYLVAVAMVTRLPRFWSRLILATSAILFIWAWFINPPYPFPFEDNVAYADFVRLHEQAAHFLEAQPGQPRILTAWPATNELTSPYLGYISRPLHVVPVQGFALQEFAGVPVESFDLLYLYSRRWEPPGNWVTRFPEWLKLQGRYFDYHPQIAPQVLAAHYHLRLLVEMERRGQWVRIYSR
ncbi:MAG: ArnT family glycosyltransferase [Terriglobia bacterium]